MFVKIHGENSDRTVVAICDEDLIGKSFKQGNLKLEVTERFYKGIKKTEEEVIETLSKASNLNLVGSQTINLVLKNGFISRESIMKISRVPHAQIY